MAKIARKGDSVSTGHLCDGSTTLDAPTGNSTVYAEGELICRLGDKTVSHNILVGSSCVPHTSAINSSSSTVYVAGALVARVGDSTGCSGTAEITSGAGTVFNSK